MPLRSDEPSENQTSDISSSSTLVSQAIKRSEMSREAVLNVSLFRQILDETFDAKLKSSFESVAEHIREELSFAKSHSDHIHNELCKVQEEQATQILALKTENAHLKERLIESETHSRRDNLIVHDIPEEKAENLDKMHESLSKCGLEMSDRTFEDAIDYWEGM